MRSFIAIQLQSRSYMFDAVIIYMYMIYIYMMIYIYSIYIYIYDMIYNMTIQYILLVYYNSYYIIYNYNFLKNINRFITASVGSAIHTLRFLRSMKGLLLPSFFTKFQFYIIQYILAIFTIYSIYIYIYIYILYRNIYTYIYIYICTYDISLILYCNQYPSYGQHDRHDFLPRIK